MKYSMDEIDAPESLVKICEYALIGLCVLILGPALVLAIPLALIGYLFGLVCKRVD